MVFDCMSRQDENQDASRDCDAAKSCEVKMLTTIEHVVVLMLETRSFDHMLGFLYAERGDVAPGGQAFDGLTGKESNKDGSGKAVQMLPVLSGLASGFAVCDQWFSSAPTETLPNRAFVCAAHLSRPWSSVGDCRHSRHATPQRPESVPC
jgi:phospholipase C